MVSTQGAPRHCRPFHDLREYLAAVKEMKQLKIVEGADGELEIGALTGIIGARKDCPVSAFRRDQRLFPRHALDDQYAE